MKTGDTIVIEADSAKVEEIPAPTAVQEQDLPHLETDLKVAEKLTLHG